MVKVTDKYDEETEELSEVKFMLPMFSNKHRKPL